MMWESTVHEAFLHQRHLWDHDWLAETTKRFFPSDFRKKVQLSKVIQRISYRMSAFAGVLICAFKNSRYSLQSPAFFKESQKTESNRFYFDRFWKTTSLLLLLLWFGSLVSAFFWTLLLTTTDICSTTGAGVSISIDDSFLSLIFKKNSPWIYSRGISIDYLWRILAAIRKRVMRRFVQCKSTVHGELEFLRETGRHARHREHFE